MQDDQQYWLERWQAREIEFNQAEPNVRLVKFYSKLQLHKNASVLVPLCGKSIDMLWLAKQGVNVIGIELSDIACKQFFAEQELTPLVYKQNGFTVYQYSTISIWCGDFFKLPVDKLPKIDAIYDRAALVALPADIRRDYVKQLARCVPEDSRVLLITVEYPPEARNEAPFAVFTVEVKQLCEPYFTVELLAEEQGVAPPHLAAAELTYWRNKIYLLTRLAS